MGGWVVNATPWLLYPLERDPLPIVQEAGWAQGWSRWVQKISLPPGFKPQTVQPVASRFNPYMYCLYYNNHVKTWLPLNLTFTATLEHKPAYHVKDESQIIHYYEIEHLK